MSNYIINPFFEFGQPVIVTRNAWVELARTTLGAPNANVDVIVPTPKRFYMILFKSTGQDSVNSNTDFLVGDSTGFDTGTNYAFRRSLNGALDVTVTNAIRMLGDSWNGNAGTADPIWTVFYVDNSPIGEKLASSHSMQQENPGAGNFPERNETVGKWDQVTGQIDRFRAFITAGNNWNTGTEMIVLGFDPADGLNANANYWQKLASTETITLSEYLEVSFTPTKYLWVQASYLANSNVSGVQWNTRMGTTTIDTGVNYAYRQSRDGGAEIVLGSQNRINGGLMVANERAFVNMFITNEDNQEKLLIGHLVGNRTNGAGNIPQRTEFVGKFVNPTGPNDQIDIIRVGDEFSAGEILDGSLTVWGHN